MKGISRDAVTSTESSFFAAARRSPGSKLVRSFKFGPQTLHSRRVLLRLGSGLELPDPVAAIAGIDIPVDLTRQVQSLLPTATSLHIGLDQHRDGSTLRLYVERPEGLAASWIDGGRVTIVGFKWPTGGGAASSTTLYRPIDHLTIPDGTAGARRAITGLLSRHETSAHLTVRDLGSPRDSRDVAFAQSTVELGWIASDLLSAARSLDAPINDIEKLIHQESRARVGRLAFGADVAGQPFITVYAQRPGEMLGRSSRTHDKAVGVGC